MSSYTAIVGCGSVGKHVEQLEKANNPFCITKSTQSANTLIKQGVDAKALNLTALTGLEKPLSQTFIYYFVPPPPKGCLDSTIGHFLKLISVQHCKKIILISTTGVYGNCNGNWIDETQPLNPTADRAKRRVDAEQQLITLCKQHNIDYTILRVPGIYGPNKLPIARLQSGKAILALNESPFSNRIHIEDLAMLAYNAMHKTLPLKIYNVGDNQPSSMSDYFIAVAKALNLKQPKQITLKQAKVDLSASMISYLVESKRINNQALLTHLNCNLKYPTLKEGLEKQYVY